MQSALAREYRKMYRNLNGIRTLNRMPECLVIIDPNKEKNAIKEARALGITTVVADRYRLRSGPGRSADSRQRRRHPLDRADHAAPGRSRARRLAERCRRSKQKGDKPAAARPRWHAAAAARSEGWERLSIIRADGQSSRQGCSCDGMDCRNAIHFWRLRGAFAHPSDYMQHS